MRRRNIKVRPIRQEMSDVLSNNSLEALSRIVAFLRNRLAPEYAIRGNCPAARDGGQHCPRSGGSSIANDELV